MVMQLEVISKYLTLSDQQHEKLAKLHELILAKNEVVNLISRKDTENVETHHLLHSLALYGYLPTNKSARILDIGTGGGFPGLPLAIMYPLHEFLLVDSIKKKVDAVAEFAQQLGLENVKAQQIRAEHLKGNFDYVVSRAVTRLPVFTNWVWKNIKPGEIDGKPRGILYLRGMDFDKQEINSQIHKGFEFEFAHEIQRKFGELFFNEKFVVFLRRK
ncbi:MAG: 16S rRNA (guanine(527)-N(7))-methyltransferase RsmG [Bacteroidetes bacterium]|nr:16S rRNA (guanine(527)-N(7))-methyltransferase RsmG [Bacteroidota bacterium]